MFIQTWKLLAAAAVAAGLAAGGIGIARAVGDPGRASTVPPAITVTATDATMRVVGDEAVRPGWTRIADTNDSSSNHALGVWRLRDGVGVDDLRKGLDTPDGLGALQLVDAYGGVDDVAAHTTFSMTARLDPGRYVLIDFGQGPEGPDGPAWFTKTGFVHEFEVRGKPTTARPPASTATLVASDFHYVVPQTLPRHGTLEVRNAGSELHMAALLRLDPGATVASALSAIRAGKEPPGTQLELFGAIGPGRAFLMDYDLAPASYVIACFMPSKSHESAPHVALGMVNGFTVR
jgi:hypothetical protein